ncbi:MAG: NAD(P)/FAD-dependent oxidoreductase, partial [Acidimicrobiales bacterium]
MGTHPRRPRWLERAFSGTVYRSFWLDDPSSPPPRQRLSGEVSCDLAIVGAGFTGLWAALLAKEADDSLDVVVLEQASVASAASGRNGGFCDASLTHGVANGLARFPDEMELLESLGLENLCRIAESVKERGIDCDFELNGTIDVAVRPWQVDELAEHAEAARRLGHDVELLGEDEVRGEICSPTYLAGIRSRGRTAMVNPARLAWGLAQACENLGVRIHEETEVSSVARDGAGLRLGCEHGTLRAGRAVLATNAHRSLLRRVRPYVLPVYDYVLVTEPLSSLQRAEIGWTGRQGIGDAGNQFHYYRLTADDRVLFGGYDAVYHFANRLEDALDRRPATFDMLAEHLLATFPQLEGISFSHAWGGAIDTCSRFCAFYGTAYGGRAAYAAGFTG